MESFLLYSTLVIINSLLGFASFVYGLKIWKETDETKDEIKSIIIRYILWPATTTKYILDRHGVDAMDYNDDLPPMLAELGSSALKLATVFGIALKIGYNLFTYATTLFIMSLLLSLTATMWSITTLGGLASNMLCKKFGIDIKKMIER